MNQNTILENTDTAEPPILWTALITPLDDNGDIDYPSLGNLVLAQNAANNGILLLGSTGEGLALTYSEQLAIVEYVCAMTVQVPLMVAVAGYNLSQQLAWIAKCNTLAIDAYLLTSPIYAKPGPIGQTQWFNQLLDAADLPCMLYNVPSRTGGEIALSALAQVQGHPNCWALKEASGDLNKLLAYRQHCPDIELYSGEDAMMPFLAAADVKGLVSVSANVWPQATKRYVELALAQQTDGLFQLWSPAIAALFQVTSPIPVKVLLAQLKRISSATLRLPLCQSEISANHGLMTIHEDIQQWWLAQPSAPLATARSASQHATAVNPNLITPNLRAIN
ncbi:4-hydroxy-tetrahydrodipicolinate synthase [Colwellia chukchiensis]|uniref:4-hydroxy-tetrahydrodipicolinate synthase n=1 Tax=Colwellia chukchiensis TaxID=641665 RepID=A0A1H7LHZ5_9GAMM|nr:4-hydroxy-tetrahydrodipicolinate synthase [Colwellia chukchiensis]SEK98582.1 4-hydroxy-tetrahydrodipicolinate synthase [Colwellia chukchiensis]